MESIVPGYVDIALIYLNVLILMGHVYQVVIMDIMDVFVIKVIANIHDLSSHCTAFTTAL